MDLPDNIRLEVIAPGIKLDQLHKELDNHFSNSDTPPKFVVSSPKTDFRSVEPSVLVAIITASATALGAFITGLLTIVKQREAKKIVIRGKSGETLEVPVEVSLEKIDQLLERLRKMDQPQIIISSNE